MLVEQINSTSGIGYLMELARQYGQTDIIIVGLVLYGILGLLSDAPSGSCRGAAAVLDPGPRGRA